MASVSEIQKDVSDMSFDYMFKILIIGNSTVGKTALLFRYCDDTYTSAFVPTVGIDFKVKTINFKNKKIKLQLWDTAGQERYRTITTTYYRGAMGFLLVYDITKEESFLAARDWASQINTYAWENAQVVLVGNKCDKQDERVISTEQGKHLADELGMTFIETSAKENLNVDKVVHALMEQIVKKINEEGISEDAFTTARIGQHRLPSTPTIKPKGCDC